MRLLEIKNHLQNLRLCYYDGDEGVSTAEVCSPAAQKLAIDFLVNRNRLIPSVSIKSYDVKRWLEDHYKYVIGQIDQNELYRSTRAALSTRDPLIVDSQVPRALELRKALTSHYERNEEKIVRHLKQPEVFSKILN